jgi:hypothetical protein
MVQDVAALDESVEEQSATVVLVPSFPLTVKAVVIGGRSPEVVVEPVDPVSPPLPVVVDGNVRLGDGEPDVLAVFLANSA